MNQAIQQLDIFRGKLDLCLDKFFKEKIETSKQYPLLPEMIKHIHDSCKKGKRLRAAFIYFGYLACGGNQEKMILELSAYVELLHCYFLIHDDIMDQDSIRRGMPTMHIKYEKIHRQRYTRGDAKHFGMSVAIMAGELADELSYEIIAKSKLSDRLKTQVIKKNNSFVFDTIAGQLLDMNLEMKNSFSKKDILTVYKLKTAQYTVEGPLHIGAITAGKNDKKTLDKLTAYAVPLGIAFQIQDDILGIFGNEKKIGKPVGSDIREDKRTLLVWKAYHKASVAQKKTLDRCLGNKKLTAKQIDDFRQVVVETGSLAYAQKTANKLSTESLQVINKTKLNPAGKEFLVGIADYLVNRDY